MRTVSPPFKKAARPDVVKTLLVRALQLLKASEFDAVIPLCKQVLSLAPGNFDALYYLGVAYGEIGKDSEAIQFLKLASKANPAAIETRSNLGKALLNAEQFTEAHRVFSALTARAPAYMDGWLGLLSALRKLGRNDEALNIAKTAITNAGNVGALLNERGLIYLALNRFHDAALDFEAAAHSTMASEEVFLNLSYALLRLGKNEAAVKVLEDLYRRSPNNMTVQRRLAQAYRNNWQAAQGAMLARKLLDKNPSDLELSDLLAECLVDSGDIAGAQQIFRKTINTAQSTHDGQTHLISALKGLAPIHKFSAEDPEIEMTRELLGRSELSDQSRSELLFALAKMEDDTGNFGEAIRCATNAKLHDPPERRFEQQMQFVRAVLPRFNTEFFANRLAIGRNSTEPVFVIGMPRSGTTLTEQIIASHVNADGAGELISLPSIAHSLGFEGGSVEHFIQKLESLSGEDIGRMSDYYLSDLMSNRKAGALRITDKLPHNFLNVWLIALLFPNAHIIQCKRHPVDVAISIYLREFNKSHSYAVDLASLGRYIKFYEEVTAHWRNVCGLKWYENTYEDMVSDPEPNIRRMIDFLGLPWDDRCLAHTETERSVHTFSKWQVRQPIYKTSVERWRKYAPYIKPLLDELGIEA